MTDKSYISECKTCGQQIEFVPGIPGSVWMTDYWRHADNVQIGDVRTTGQPGHAAEPVNKD